MPKPSTPSVWASGKSFAFQPSLAQQAQGFDYIASVRPGTGAPITDDHDWPLNQVTNAIKWIMDQIPNDGLRSAAFRDVGNSQNQIPDMSYFQATKSSSGRFMLPNGYVKQWGVGTPDQTGDFSILYDVAFSSKPTFIGFGYRQLGVPGVIQSVVVNESTNINTGFSGRALMIRAGTNGLLEPSPNTFYWSAEGFI